MSELNTKTLSVDEIIEKVKEEAKNKVSNQEDYLVYEYPILQNNRKNNFYNYAKKIGKYLQKIGLGSFVRFVKSNLILHKNTSTYNIKDLEKYHDEEFLKNIYRLLLNREIDFQGKSIYLPKLRDGSLSKNEIITSLHYSSEGQAQDITISGIRQQRILAILYKLPYINYPIKIIVMLATLPKLLDRINKNENFVGAKLVKNENKYLELSKIIKTKASMREVQILQEDMETKANIKELEIYLSSINYARKQIDISKENIQTLIDEAKKRMPNQILSEKETLSIIDEEENFDSFYVSFEDQFRGSKEEIKDKLKVYIPYMEKFKTDVKILDVGCGRGEWLELLSDNGYKNTKGIDLNKVMVTVSKELDLDAECTDVIKYLKSLDDESLMVITGFHIIEHLPFNILMTLFKESLRVLKKGGMIIYETPNPRNILVGSSDFYLDPTHISPLHPQTLKFLVIESGFSQVKSLILDKDILTNFDHLKFDSIDDYINIGRDLVVIGYKI